MTPAGTLPPELADGDLGKLAEASIQGEFLPKSGLTVLDPWCLVERGTRIKPPFAGYRPLHFTGFHDSLLSSPKPQTPLEIMRRHLCFKIWQTPIVLARSKHKGGWIRKLSLTLEDTAEPVA